MSFEILAARHRWEVKLRRRAINRAYADPRRMTTEAAVPMTGSRP
jgi:hypothetical protein